jgi:hypothetical protein
MKYCNTLNEFISSPPAYLLEDRLMISKVAISRETSGKKGEDKRIRGETERERERN